jgi:dipeptidyl aminopeptidase/acylaminoacyl peptidase
MMGHEGHEGLEGIVFQSGGHRLLGTLFLAKGDDPKPTTLLLHGCPGIEKNHDIALALREQGWNALVFHYRGSWGSEGAFSLGTLPDDVIAALDYLEGGVWPQVDAERLGLVGHSLGGWAAVIAAAEDQRARGVCVYGGVVDLRTRDYSADFVAREFTPWLHGSTPEQFLTEVDELHDRYAPLDRVASVSPRPLMVIHGGSDTHVPTDQARRLFDRAGDPREFILIPDANHGFSWHRRELIGHIANWVNRLRLR